MPNTKYLIVGGGMAADAALHGIRERDRSGSIALIGAEPHPPCPKLLGNLDDDLV